MRTTKKVISTKNEFRIPLSRPDFSKVERDAMLRVFDSNWLSQGRVTEEFERALSEYLSSDAIVVNNGSSALMCALMAHGLKPNDKVIVPDFTFIATSSIPKIFGAKIMIADSNVQTLNIEPESVADIVKKHEIKMVIIVDVGGSPVDIDAFTDLAKRYKFTLIEDAAQGFGSEYKNRNVGSFDHTTIFSFQATKLLSTIEGGCIATKNKGIIQRIRKIKDYGRTKERYVHDAIGTNFRTTDLQSAIGIKQLQKIEDYISRRGKIANEYRKYIENLEFQDIPKFVTKHTNTLFFALAESKHERDTYLKHLIEKKIDARKPWRPIHMQPCNSEFTNYSLKNTQNIFERAFLLPIYNSMTMREAKFVIDSINEIKK